MVSPSALAEEVGDVLLLVQCPIEVNDPSWEHMISLILRKPERKVLVVSSNHAPTAQQRARFVEAIKGHKVRFAILSSWSIVRGSIRAIQWLSALDIQGFPTNAHQEALEYLESVADPEQIQRRVEALTQLASKKSA